MTWIQTFITKHLKSNTFMTDFIDSFGNSYCPNKLKIKRRANVQHTIQSMCSEEKHSKRVRIEGILTTKNIKKRRAQKRQKDNKRQVNK